MYSTTEAISKEELIRQAQREHRRSIHSRYEMFKNRYDNNEAIIKRTLLIKGYAPAQVRMYLDISVDYKKEMDSYVNDYPEYFV